MANRSNHYEAAFEDYLRSERIPYVAVDEQRRALSADGSLKSVDFILSPEPVTARADTRWLVDVKGRRFPSGQSRKEYWRNWTTVEELESLAKWSERFGPQFEAALVFAFHLVADRAPIAPEQVHFFRDQAYAFVAVRLSEYRQTARLRSKSWKTVSVSAPQFRRMAKPLGDLICQEAPWQATLVS